MIFRQSYAFYLVAARKSYISHIKFGLFISKVNRIFAVKREYPGLAKGCCVHLSVGSIQPFSQPLGKWLNDMEFILQIIFR